MITTDIQSNQSRRAIMLETYLIFSNLLLIGCIVILYRGAVRAHKKAEHLEDFAKSLVHFMVETSDKTAEELAKDFNRFSKANG
jgi:hypothetical protein